MRLAQLRQRLADLGAKPCHQDRVLRAWCGNGALDNRRSRAEDFLPAAVRAALPEFLTESDGLARAVSEHPGGDGSARLLVALADGATVESVLLLREGLGLGLTVHSGEACGPEYVWDTLRSLKPQRLGHGVAVGADPALIAEVKRLGVTIEVCPTSNLRTRAVPSLAQHPARLLMDAGVSICLNTDDPGLFDLTLSGELAVAQHEMGFDEARLRRVQELALAASFVPEDQKRGLLG